MRTIVQRQTEPVSTGMNLVGERIEERNLIIKVNRIMGFTAGSTTTAGEHYC